MKDETVRVLACGDVVTVLDTHWSTAARGRIRTAGWLKRGEGTYLMRVLEWIGAQRKGRRWPIRFVPSVGLVFHRQGG